MRRPMDAMTQLRNTRASMGDGTLGGRSRIATPYRGDQLHRGVVSAPGTDVVGPAPTLLGEVFTGQGWPTQVRGSSRDGDPSWVWETADIEATAAVASTMQGPIYAVSVRSRLLMKVLDGQLLWTASLDFPTATNSPAGLVVSRSDDSAVYAGLGSTLQKLGPDGAVLWSVERPGYDLSAVTLNDDETALYLGNNGNVYRLDPGDGTEVWHVFTTGTAQETDLGCSGIAAAGDAVYIGNDANSSYFARLEASTGADVWRLTGQTGMSGGVVVTASGYVVAAVRGSPQLRRRSDADGSVVWGQDLPHWGRGIAAAGGAVYCYADGVDEADKDVFKFNEDGEFVWRSRLGHTEGQTVRGIAARHNP